MEQQASYAAMLANDYATWLDGCDDRTWEPIRKIEISKKMTEKERVQTAAPLTPPASPATASNVITEIKAVETIDISADMKVEATNAKTLAENYNTEIEESISISPQHLLRLLGVVTPKTSPSSVPTHKSPTSSSLLAPHSPSSTASSSSSSSKSILTTEWFDVRRSPKGGYGSFAVKDIKSGTLILSEPYLLQCGEFGIRQEFDLLSAEDKKKFMSLACWNKVETSKIAAIYKTNRTTNNQCGIFIDASRFNHACQPINNCTYEYFEDEQRLKVYACKDIAQGDEITISYTSASTTLYANYGFFCDCGGCYLTEQEKRNEIVKADAAYERMKQMMRFRW